MTSPHARAKKAAKALDLYEQAINLATEVVRDYSDIEFLQQDAIDELCSAHAAFRTLRQMMDRDVIIAKEQKA